MTIQPPAGQMFKEQICHKYCINGPYYEFEIGKYGKKRACRVLHDEAGWYWFYGIHFKVNEYGQTVFAISCGLEDTYEEALKACEKEGEEEITWVI